MLLNSKIWKETVSAAKAAASTSPAWLRAIDRAVIEIEKSKYWSLNGGVLTIISTTSKRTYKIDDAHTCEACANGHSACKHRAARRLMIRYTERLNTQPAPAASAPRLVRRVERDHNGLKVTAVYCDGWAV